MGYIKNPRKFVETRIRDFGGAKQLRLDARKKDSRGTTWAFPDGHTVFILDCIHMGAAAGIVRDLQDRYGPRRNHDTPFAGTKRSGAPRLDLTRLTASAHAQERLRLMRSQDRVEFSDILHALRLPVRTLWSDVHGSWIWVGVKVAVPVRVLDSGAAIILTVLWATEELWEANPRPTK